MNENIIVADILRGKQKGFQMYSPTFGNIFLENVYNDGKIRIYSCDKDGNEDWAETINPNGSLVEDGECCIFPSKENRDWTTMLQKGDIVVMTLMHFDEESSITMIFNEYHEDETFSAMARLKGKDDISFNRVHLLLHAIVSLRFATNEEKCELFKAMEKEGKMWNPYTFSIDEKPMINLEKGAYYYFEMENELSYIAKFVEYRGKACVFGECISWNSRCGKSESYDFEPDNFSIPQNYCYGIREATSDEIERLKKVCPNMFETFDYVLCKSIACYEGDAWNLFQYAYQNKEGIHIMVGGAAFKTCIPYIGNESLLGTTKDVKG